MNPDDDLGGDLSQFSMLDLFRMETREQARALTDGLLQLERGEGDAATLEALMRAAHSVKGAAAIVASEPMVRLAHALEDVFVAAQRGALALGTDAVDLLLAGVDLMPRLAAPEGDAAAGLDAQLEEQIAALAALRAAAPATRPRAQAPAPPAVREAGPAPVADAGNPAANLAGNLAGSAAGALPDDELLALASQTRLHTHQLSPWIASLQRYRRQQRGAYEAMDALREAIVASGNADLIERVQVLAERARPLKDTLHRHIREAENYERRALSVATRLVDQVLALRMCRFGDGLHGLPRMVRDLARSLGKEARLDLRGAGVLVDRAVLARIEGPLGQLLRNAVDHGLEYPDERLAAGKPLEGAIRLEARHRGGMLSIQVSDDGRGVDPERIRRAAVARGLAAPAIAAGLSAAELMEFLFLPGFSLKDEANQVSGRGVGMDVVHDAVQALNGAVRAESEPGAGFRTTITLPLTQSIVRALVVDVGGEAYALPIARVERVLRVAAGEVRTLAGRQVIDTGGEQLGLVAAGQVLGLGETVAGAALAVVVLGSGSGNGRERYGLVVDAIRGEQSLTVQPLEPTFGKLRDVASAALLDDGAAVLILDVPDLLQSIARLLDDGAALQLADAAHAASDGAAPAGRMARRILVADDSLTVREIQRKILAAHGYRVDVATDGIDGWNQLHAAVDTGDPFDLAITDVDMPRLDGIQLVARIRHDARLQRLPVMIVSYKDREEDRARGLEAGADYYLAKGAFHDATLLDAVRDLVGPAVEGRP